MTEQLGDSPAGDMTTADPVRPVLRVRVRLHPGEASNQAMHRVPDCRPARCRRWQRRWQSASLLRMVSPVVRHSHAKGPGAVLLRCLPRQARPREGESGTVQVLRTPVHPHVRAALSVRWVLQERRAGQRNLRSGQVTRPARTARVEWPGMPRQRGIPIRCIGRLGRLPQYRSTHLRIASEHPRILGQSNNPSADNELLPSRRHLTNRLCLMSGS